LKEFRYLRKGVICLGVQFVCWMAFSVGDLWDEMYNTPMWELFFFVLPAATMVLYFIFRKKIYEKEIPGVLDVVILIINWLIVATLLGVLITYMTCDWNNWIVKQATGGWENFLNGIEYPLFGIFQGISVPIIIILGELVILLVRVLEKNSKTLPE